MIQKVKEGRIPFPPIECAWSPELDMNIPYNIIKRFGLPYTYDTRPSQKQSQQRERERAGESEKDGLLRIEVIQHGIIKLHLLSSFLKLLL